MLFNTNRVAELFHEEAIEKTAHAFIRLPSKRFFIALAKLWFAFLLMVFTLILAVRFANSLPL